MDLSLVGYFLMILSLAMAALFFSQRAIVSVAKVFNQILLALFIFTLIADLELYRHWGYRIDATPLFYLGNPHEAFASLKIWTILLLLGLAILLFIIFKKIYFRFIFGEKTSSLSNGRWWYLPVFVFLSAMMIIPIRGGLGVAPMNPGKVYFSQNIFSNHAALNGIWNMGYGLSLLNSMSKRYPQYADFTESEQFFNSIKTSNNKTKKVLKTSRPNVVIIMLESFTSKVIEPLGGLKDVSPSISALSDNGLLFTRIYASGDRSDKGIISVLAGFPAQSTQSIILFPPKAVKLPTISQVFNSLGYQTTFYYAGDPDFANIKSFLLSSGFQRLVTVDDFPKETRTTNWGAPDEYAFRKLLEELDLAKSHFFKVLFTLSSHEPFDIPEEPKFPGILGENKFLSSISYTDKWLGWFFKEAVNKPWYDSTLFVLIADHGHRYPGNNHHYSPKKFEIPMLWVGGALDSTGLVTRTGSQIDLASTLLSQLNYEPNEFIFSRNLLSNSSNNFAYYAFNDGFGFITDSCHFIWDHAGQIAIKEDSCFHTKAEAFKYFKFYYNYFLGL